MSQAKYSQNARLGENSVPISRREIWGEDYGWWRFKKISAIILWVLCGVLMITGAIWWGFHFSWQTTPISATSVNQPPVVVNNNITTGGGLAPAMSVPKAPTKTPTLPQPATKTKSVWDNPQNR